LEKIPSMGEVWIFSGTTLYKSLSVIHQAIEDSISVTPHKINCF